jgi:hypothetical protein
MINKICIRWPYNFKKYLSKKYYQTNHPDGVSYPSLVKRITIAWKLRNEPTLDSSNEGDVWQRNLIAH